MDKGTTKLDELLREHGYSATKQRHIIFKALLHKDPMTVRELYEITKKHLDRASMYRIVELFEKLGIITRLSIGWKYKIELSDTFSDHHHHLTCLNCHKITSINRHELEQFITHLAHENNFIALEHQVEIQGYCQNCTKIA